MLCFLCRITVGCVANMNHTRFFLYLRVRELNCVFREEQTLVRSRGTVARISMGDNLTDGSNPVNKLSTMSLNAELSRIATTRDH